MSTEEGIQYVDPPLKERIKDAFRVGDRLRSIQRWLIRALGGVPTKKDGNLYRYARDEMDLVWSEPDEMQDLVKSNILDLVSVFSGQGHSGFSAGYVLSVFNQVARFDPLGPLTGKDEEWQILDYEDEMYAQNRRRSSVFMRRDGTAYDIDAVIFREPDGMTFTSNDSIRDITFPYTPETIIVDVDEDDNAIA